MGLRKLAGICKHTYIFLNNNLAQRRIQGLAYGRGGGSVGSFSRNLEHPGGGAYTSPPPLKYADALASFTFIEDQPIIACSESNHHDTFCYILSKKMILLRKLTLENHLYMYTLYMYCSYWEQ